MATSVQKQLEASKARVAKLTEDLREAKKGRTEMQKEVRQAVAGERQAKKALVQSQNTISRLEKQLEEAGLRPVTKRR